MLRSDEENAAFTKLTVSLRDVSGVVDLYRIPLDCYNINTACRNKPAAQKLYR